VQDFSTEKPMSWTHFNAEGDVEFKAVLFIPPTAPYDLFENYYSNTAMLKLYVRRVFISDEFDELLPKYLSFLKVWTGNLLLQISCYEVLTIKLMQIVRYSSTIIMLYTGD
jgi:HSP90 family molecular chaperone